MRNLLTAVVLGIVGFVALSFGQATDGIIVGNVVDPAGAAIPNASVTATNKATGVRYSASTNVSGDYRINNVPVGTYDIDTTASGMTSLKLAGVVVELNRTTTSNFKMTIASASTVVEVTVPCVVIVACAKAVTPPATCLSGVDDCGMRSSKLVPIPL